MEDRHFFVGLFIFLCIYKHTEQTEPRNINGTINHLGRNMNKSPRGIVFPMERTPSQQARIVGGVEAKPHAYPFQVGLKVVRGGGTFLCGASLISNEWILTAAHCLLNASYVIVYLGVHDMKESDPLSKVFEASRFLIHGKYSKKDLYNDIGLVKLPEKIKFNAYIKPVEIASGPESYEGTDGRCLGWGIAESGKTQHKLRFVDLHILPNEKCSHYNEFKKYITERHMCTTGELGTGSCAGDSGGPLIVDGKQVGVVSFGAVRCEAHVPSVFTRLSKYTSWLAKKTGIPIGRQIPNGGRRSTITPLVELFIGAILSAMFLNFLREFYHLRTNGA